MRKYLALFMAVTLLPLQMWFLMLSWKYAITAPTTLLEAA